MGSQPIDATDKLLMAGSTQRLIKRLILAALLIALAGATPALAASGIPQRIASFNLCADQLIVALADPQQIAGLSPYAADPALSVVAAKGA